MNKNKSFITLLICILSLGFLGASCSDMLEPSMERYTTESRYAKDSIYSAFGLLMGIQNVAERSVIMDASRSDLVTSSVYTTDSIMQLIDFSTTEDGASKLLNVADFYHIVNSCNFYLANVDTLFSKNGVVEMKREYAEVQTIRAWAYLQLVRLYGSVPFITKPISSTSEAKNQEKNAPRVTADNLVDYLIEEGLLNAYRLQRALGLPQYETIGGYPTRQLFFPVQLVLADAYLMKNTQEGYENAAQMYYDYFINMNSNNNNHVYNSSSSALRTQGVITGYSINSGGWLKAFTEKNATEWQTLSPSFSASTGGIVRSDLQHIYGFETRFTSGGATVTATENYQQIVPSKQYISLNQNQNFNRYTYDNEILVRESIEGGDGRLYASAPIVEFRNGNQTRIIDKFCPTSSTIISSLAGTDGRYNLSPSAFTMNYDVPLYRNPLIWLRYAEAINRMGFPQLAFGVLKDGLFNQNLPTVKHSDLNIYARQSVYDSISGVSTWDTIGVVQVDTIPVTTIDEITGEELTYDSLAYDTLLYADGYAPDPAKLDVPSLIEPTALSGGMYYVTLDEMLEAEKYPYIDFKTNTQFNMNNLVTSTPASRYGIHGRGCGVVAGKYDTVYTYAKMVAKKIAENYARENNLSYADQLAYEETLHNGDTLLVTDKDLIINAVEDLIVDEGALETAFEGYRFADLMRVAGHKTAAGKNGNAWFAWKIARRDYEVTEDAANKDEGLYSKLLNQKNWFYTLPNSIEKSTKPEEPVVTPEEPTAPEGPTPDEPSDVIDH